MGWFSKKPKLSLNTVVEAYVRAGVTIGYDGGDISLSWSKDDRTINHGDTSERGIERQALRVVKVYEKLRQRALEYPVLYNSNILGMLDAKLRNFLHNREVATFVASQITGEILENERNRVMVKAFQAGLDNTTEFVNLVEATSIDDVVGIERALNYKIERQLV